MLEGHTFCDNCPGCRPAIYDMKMRAVLHAAHPTMVAINWLWDHETTLAQRKAYIEVTLHNSREPEDVRLCGEVVNKIAACIEAHPVR